MVLQFSELKPNKQSIPSIQQQNQQIQIYNSPKKEEKKRINLKIKKSKGYCSKQLLRLKALLGYWVLIV